MVLLKLLPALASFGQHTEHIQNICPMITSANIYKSPFTLHVPTEARHSTRVGFAHVEISLAFTLLDLVYSSKYPGTAECPKARD